MEQTSVDQSQYIINESHSRIFLFQVFLEFLLIRLNFVIDQAADYRIQVSVQSQYTRNISALHTWIGNKQRQHSGLLMVVTGEPEYIIQEHRVCNAQHFVQGQKEPSPPPSHFFRAESYPHSHFLVELLIPHPLVRDNYPLSYRPVFPDPRRYFLFDLQQRKPVVRLLQ